MDLIRLGDRHEGLTVQVLGRETPGALAHHDNLSAEIVIRGSAEAIGSPLTLRPADLDDWALALRDLEEGRSVTWLHSPATPHITIELNRRHHERAKVIYDDQVDEGVTLELHLELKPEWIDDHRKMLVGIRALYPRETVEEGPGVFRWATKFD